MARANVRECEPIYIANGCSAVSVLQVTVCCVVLSWFWRCLCVPGTTTVSPPRSLSPLSREEARVCLAYVNITVRYIQTLRVCRLNDMSSQICLKWNSFLSNIATSFESLWEEEGLVDVTLASDGQCLTAHKVILSASSPFFKKIFQVSLSSCFLSYVQANESSLFLSVV